jgi:Fe-S cluster assembly iron-binding protein IscA
MTPQIAISPEAKLRLPADLEGGVLRITFTTGCGGSGYRLASAASPSEDDVVVEIGEIIVALDEMAARNLDGAKIEWSDEEEGYTLDHPSAVMATWCG